MSFLLRILKAKTRIEIKGGKLWEITRLWGMDVRTVEKEIPKADPFVRPEGGKIEDVRVHVLKDDNNATNLTKSPDLL